MANKAMMNSNTVEWRILEEEARWFLKETARDTVMKLKNNCVEKDKEQKRKMKKQEEVSWSGRVLQIAGVKRTNTYKLQAHPLSKMN